VERPIALGRHHNQIDVAVTSRLHDFVGRVKHLSKGKNKSRLRFRGIRLPVAMLSQGDDASQLNRIGGTVARVNPTLKTFDICLIGNDMPLDAG
jgi:hypothetical protein